MNKPNHRWGQSLILLFVGAVITLATTQAQASSNVPSGGATAQAACVIPIDATVN